MGGGFAWPTRERVGHSHPLSGRRKILINERLVRASFGEQCAVPVNSAKQRRKGNGQQEALNT